MKIAPTQSAVQRENQPRDARSIAVTLPHQLRALLKFTSPGVGNRKIALTRYWQLQGEPGYNVSKRPFGVESVSGCGRKGQL
jgi:hypothetical protein